MRLALYSCGAIISVLLISAVAVAQQKVIQVIDLTEKGMSTEGGEATLYQVKNSRPTICKIDVIHYGETGRSILEFEFGAKLNAAEAREYHYKVPLAEDPKAQPKLTNRVTMTSWEGRETLQKEFETYKSFFAASDLEQCLKG